MIRTVELWHTSGPTPTHIGTVNSLGPLDPNSNHQADMNVTLTPQGKDLIHATFASTRVGTYQIRFPSGDTFEYTGHLIHLHTNEDSTDLFWKTLPAQHPPPPRTEEPTPRTPAPTTQHAPTPTEALANAARLLAWAEAELDLARMAQYNDLAQTWVNLASLTQEPEEA